MVQQPNGKNAKQVLKKYLMFAAMGVVFVGCLWWIFAPSAEDMEKLEKGMGFNSEIPDPRGDGIVGDKRTAYEQEQMRMKQEQQRWEAERYAELFGSPDETPEERAAREQMQMRMAPKPPEYYENPERFGNNPYSSYSPSPSPTRGVRSSASAHAELTGTLGSFFEEPAADPEKDELAAEIERLNARLAEQESERTSFDAQLAMMERSYELAAKYAGGGGGTESNPAEGVAPGRRTRVEAVRRENKSVVSRLSAPGGAGAASDAEPVRHQSGEGEPNRGFNTVGTGGEGAVQTANTIAAVVHGEQTLVDGQTVRLRTVEAMRAGRHLIPRNTVITGTGKISGERLEIAVTHIEYEGNIIPVELAAYDSDGQQGIYIPGSMETEAVKEIVAGMGQSLGSTINISRQSAGEQLLTDLGRGVIQGTSQYVAKKARQVKVTLKAGYRLFLLPESNT